MAVLVRLPAMLAAALLGAACSDLADRFAPLPGELPSGIVGYARPVTPEVTGVWFAGRAADELTVIVRFSEAMDADTVQRGMFVLAATLPVRDRDDGLSLRARSSLSWNPTTTQVTLRTEPPGTSGVVLVLTEEVHSASGLALDGTAPPRPQTDPASYHRIEDDGFFAPATYVSLPYYPGGDNGLTSHPSFQLGNDRPLIACGVEIGATATTGGTLDRWAGDPLPCSLLDRRVAPTHPGIRERRGPRVWHPARLPTARLLRPSDGAVVTTTTLAGRDGRMPAPGPYFVQSLRGNKGLRLVGVSFDAAVDPAGWYIAPAGGTEPLLPITGVTPPHLLWVSDPLYIGRNGEAEGEGDVTPVLADVAGAPWIAGEWVGHRVRGAVGTATIVANSASRLELDAALACSGCRYTIEPVLAGVLQPGQTVRLVSPHVVFAPTEPVGAGRWRLEVTGGRDLGGSARTDGVRDGDENRRVANDTAVWRLDIP